MQLTDRQCWKVIRQLVSDKNTEYRKFLNSKFEDAKRTIQIQGYTRDAFLRKYRIYSLNQFFSKYKEETKSEPDRNDWIENLGSESLLIFLDFRCRVLQSIYDYYTRYMNIDIHIVTQIIDGTQLSHFAKFKLDDKNRIELSYSRKPGRAPGGEKKLSELEISSNDLKEQALAQTIGKLVGGYMHTQKVSAKDSVVLPTKLVTHNMNHRGRSTGYQYQGKIAIVPQKPVAVQETKTTPMQQPNKKEIEMRVIGFGEDRMPIFWYKGQKVDFFRNPIPDAKIVYDTNRKKIEEVDEDVAKIREKQENKQFIGIDIEGRPIYEIDGEYYNCLGQRLPEDAYIETNEESIYGR